MAADTAATMEQQYAEDPMAPAERIAERTVAVAGGGLALGALRAVAMNMPLKTPLALSTATNAGMFGATFFMAQEGAAAARGGRRDVYNSVLAGGAAGAWWSGVFSGGSPRKAVIGGLMYAGLSGVGYYAADALGASILRVRQMQAGGEAAKEAAAAGPSLGSVLEAMPRWFPVRKISQAEMEERKRELEEMADAEAEQARQRWAKENPELAAEAVQELSTEVTAGSRRG